MKKILKALLILIGLLPMICNAESEEVKWRWYTIVESDVHYEKDAKQVCEYFDENNYILGDYQHSLTEPEEKEGREIIKENNIIALDTRITNRFFINNFHINDSNVKVFEIDVFDMYNNKLNYEIEYNSLVSGDANNIKDENYETFVEAEYNSYIEIILNEPALLKGLKIIVTYERNENDFGGITFSNYLNNLIPTKSFLPHETTNTNECNENNCTFTQTTPTNDDYYETINIKAPIYKYRDKYYKCFTNKKIYVPGYHKELAGFTKDENDYIKVEREENNKENLTTPIYNNNNNNIKLPDIIVKNTFPDVIKFEPYKPVEKEPITNTYNITVKEDENKNNEIIGMLAKLNEKTTETPKENEIIMYLLEILKDQTENNEKTSTKENKQISYNDTTTSRNIKTFAKTENNDFYTYLIILMILTLIVTITFIVKKSRAK